MTKTQHETTLLSRQKTAPFSPVATGRKPTRGGLRFYTPETYRREKQGDAKHRQNNTASGSRQDLRFNRRAEGIYWAPIAVRIHRLRPADNIAQSAFPVNSAARFSCTGGLKPQCILRCIRSFLPLSPTNIAYLSNQLMNASEGARIPKHGHVWQSVRPCLNTMS